MRERERVSPTLTARGAGEEHSGMVLLKQTTFPNKINKVGNCSPSGHNASSIIEPSGISPTVIENHGTITAIIDKKERKKGLHIKNATKQGYLNAEDGDGIDISTRMEHHRGTVQKGKTQTLTCSGGNDRGVVVKDE